MVRIAVCDDETEIIEQLNALLLEYQELNDCDFLISLFKSGDELVKCAADFDLVFIDVEMPVINGIETAKVIRDKGKDVDFIYITHHAKYSVDVFTVHPFDFIEKPVSKERVCKALDDFFKIDSQRLSSEKIILCLNNTKGNEVFSISEIIMFEYSDNRKIFLYTKNDVYEINGSIDAVMEQLKKYDAFVSPHRTFIINMDWIKNVKGYIITMKNEMRVNISQRKYKEFTKLLSDYFHSDIKRGEFL